MQEPPDHHNYNWLYIEGDTFRFYLSSVTFYRSLLERDLDNIKMDPDLLAILGDPIIQTFPVYAELERVKTLESWFQEMMKTDSRDSFDLNVSHRWVRTIKSMSLLYLKHLQSRRNMLSKKDGLTKSILSVVDQRLSALEEKTRIGVFENASEIPLLTTSAPLQNQDNLAESPRIHSSNDTVRPKPVVIDSIEIVDPDLRKRCLDLFKIFQEGEQPERLDTVLTEATRILEDKLRLLACAESKVTGLELASFAFAGIAPKLLVSDIQAEQEAVHLLFRGVFGFIRNSVHHRLVNSLDPVRVLQTVALIDYLLFVAQGARRTKPGS